MRRQCYVCLEKLTSEESAKGQAVVKWIELNAEAFEGWVHCNGPRAQFIQKTDKELKKLLTAMGITFYEGTIHVCEKCVRKQALQEGVTVPKSVI